MMNFTDIERLELNREGINKSVSSSKYNYYLVSKRIVDLVIAAVSIILILAWLIPILGIFIKLTSPGPILFLQQRTGKNGRPFRCYKLRTMQHSSTNKFEQASRNDPRVTSVGKVLRKTNLDEFPQLINVLIGDMSIVGPRPHAIQHDAQYWQVIPDYRERYAVKPGITGLAQVRGCRGETPRIVDMRHRVRFDKWYINNRSLRLDILICWWTIKNMFGEDKKAW